MSKITVDIVGDSSKFKNALGQADTAGKRFSKTAAKGFGLGVGIGAFNLAAGAVSTFIGSLDDAKAAYLEDAASQDMLAAAFNRAGVARNTNLAAIEAQITANQLLGVSDSAQRDGIAAFLRLTNDATTATALNTATIELAAATGKTYEEANANIVSGLAGRATALKKDGIEVTKNMTAMDLAAAITDKYEGSQEKLSQTEVGKRVVAEEKVGEAMEKVGKVVATVSNAVLPVFADALSFVIDTLGQAGKAIGGVTATVTKALIPVFKAVAPVVSTVFGIVGKVIGTAVGLVKSYFGTIGKAIGILGSAFSGLQQIASKVWSVISGVFKGGVNLVIGIVNGIIRGINSIQVHIGRIGVDVPGVGFVGVGPFDWNGLGLGYLKYMHSGGIVPGVPGSNVPIMAQAGERVVPRNQANGGGPTIIVNGNIYGVSGVEELSDMIARRLRLVGT